MNPDQVTALHRSRLAYVYIRQSSQHQVLHHQESQRRQRDLKTRATALGWPDQLVHIIDEDLGRTAARGHQRSGFAGMVAEVALGKAGIILALEASRLTRGNRDWYHLLDICAVTGTLIGDAEGLYNPRDYNDRLLLGLKGTMSEAELHVMKQRLVEAMRAKAKRGEFRFRPPPGYTRDEARGLHRRTRPSSSPSRDSRSWGPSTGSTVTSRTKGSRCQSMAVGATQCAGSCPTTGIYVVC